MDYPHGHHHGRHQAPDRRDEDYAYPPPGGPPPYGVNEPPPPQPYHTSHIGPGPDTYYPPPPPQVYHGGPGPDPYHHPPPHGGPGPDPYHHPPPHGGPGPDPYHPPPAYHSSHIGPGPDTYHAPPPPTIPGHFPPPPNPHAPPIVNKEAEWARKPSVRMYSKAEPNYSLTIRNGKVILARSDPSDPLQHWVKDLKYSTRVKDEEGFPSFALVNKATGQAMKHALGATKPVQLIPYNPDVVDESIMWTESKDLGDSYRTIRMVNNIRLNVDAFNGDKNHGGVHDGTTIVLWEWKKGDNQRWKIVPHCKSHAIVPSLSLSFSPSLISTCFLVVGCLGSVTLVNLPAGNVDGLCLSFCRSYYYRIIK